MSRLTIQELHEAAIRDLFAALADATAPYDKAQLTAAIKNLQTAQNEGLSAGGGNKDAFTSLVEAAMSKQQTTDQSNTNHD